MCYLKYYDMIDMPISLVGDPSDRTWCEERTHNHRSIMCQVSDDCMPCAD